MMLMVMNILIFAAGLLTYLGYGLPGFLYLAGAILISWIAATTIVNLSYHSLSF